MFYIKIIDLILIIAICTYIGMIKASTFNRRVTDLRNFKSALGMFKTKIEFTYEPLNVIFNEISKVIYSEKENVFKNFNKELEEINDSSLAWQNSVNKSNFKACDKEIIIMLGKMLGKTDKDGQLSEINLISEFIDKQIEEAIMEKQKNEKLYKTLGIAFGITIVLILV
jgi:stage III sporulation protein AB